MRLSLRPSSIPPTPEEILSVAADLRAELDATEAGDLRALLLFDVGVLEELHRDDHGAAKDLLAAVNQASNLSEPLERLIALVERRHSFQNLGKLLDRLGRVASTPEEVVRAQLARGDFLTDHRHDDEGARQAYALAEQAGVELPSVWLGLELLAGKQQDRELHKRVTSSRAAATLDPNYRALLRLRAAESALAQDDERGALRLLEQLVHDPSPARDRALHALERIAEKHGDLGRLADLREQRAQGLTQSFENPQPAALGLEHGSAPLAAATELWVRAAKDRRELGDADRSLANLARAERLLADNPAVLHELCRVSAEVGNTPRMSQAIAHLQQSAQLSGAGAAALYFRLATAESRAGDAGAALTALGKALHEDPKCVPARALQLHLLLAHENPSALADVWETCAAEARDDRAKARYYALAALCWSSSKNNGDAARAALSQAALSGLSVTTCARLGRLFARRAGDTRWSKDAIERVCKHDTLEELPSVLLDLSRVDWLDQRSARARETLARLEKHSGGAWLAATLGAYAGLLGGANLGHPDPDRSPVPTPSEAPGATAPHTSLTDERILALCRLSELLPPSERAALLSVVAWQQRSADHEAASTRLLEELQRQHPSDLVIGQQLAQTLRAFGQHGGAARVLAEMAELVGAAEQRTALQLEAGIVAWRGGDRGRAVELFSRAGDRSPNTSTALLQWGLRAAQPDAADARERALTAAFESTGDGDVYALESFALHVAAKDALSLATGSLDRADDVSLSESGEAVQLARALWRHSRQHKAALRHIEAYSSSGQEVAHAVRFAELWAEPQPQAQRVHQQAKAWAATGSPVGALEWLATSMAVLDPEDELAARQRVTALVADPARAQLQAGTRLLELLVGSEPPALLDEPSAEARLCNLELAPPGTDPRRRALALGGVADAFGESSEALCLALAGQNELVAQRHDAALASFRAVVRSYPDDIIAWDGLRLAAQNLEERKTEAEACLKLGELSADPKTQARFFRDAATLFLDELQDEAAGRAALQRAVALDIHHKQSFVRLYALLKQDADPAAINQLLERRIEVSNDAGELVTLYWDRARSYRQLDELDRALEELTNLNLLEPGHVGARALRGEIYLRQQRFAEAAAELAELSRMDNAPSDQRLMGGIAAVDLYESRLDDLTSALIVLDGLDSAALDTLAVQERLARATAKAERWEDAARLLEELTSRRKTSAGRADAARLLLAVYRDKLKTPERAHAACEAVLAESPTDPEVIDFVLEEGLGERETQDLLSQIKGALLTAPLSDLSGEQVARIARVAEALDDLPLRQAALGSLICIGVTSQELREELAELDSRSERHPKVVLRDLADAGLLHPQDQGFLSRVFALLGPHLPELLGPNLDTLAVGRRERVKSAVGSSLRAEIAAYAGCFGLGDFELYIGGNDPQAIVAIADPKLARFVIGSQVQAPLSSAQRARLAAQVFALVRGTSLLLTRELVDAAAFASAACAVGGVKLPGPAPAVSAEYERTLNRLPRKVKKDLTQLCSELLASNPGNPAPNPLAWASAARASLDRTSALLVGDVSWVLLRLEERLALDRKLESNQEHRTWPLLRFVLSPTFLELRTQLGLAAR